LKQRYVKFRNFGKVLEKQQAVAQKAEPAARVEA